MKIKKMIAASMLAVSLLIPIISSNMAPVMAISDPPLAVPMYEEETLTERFNLEPGTIIQFDAKIRRNGNTLYYVSASNWDAYYSLAYPNAPLVNRLTFTRIAGLDIYMNVYGGRNGNNYIYRCVYNYYSGGRLLSKEPF